MASEGPGVGAVVGAGMMLLVVVGLAMFVMRKDPSAAHPPPPPPPPASTTAAPPPIETAVAASPSGPMRLNDPANTQRYLDRRKTLEAITAGIPDVAARGVSVVAGLQKKCDDAAGDLTMLGAEPDKKVRAFVESFKRTCEYDLVGAALDKLLTGIEAARKSAPAKRPADCTVAEPFTKSVADHHYEDDPAMKDRLVRFGANCL